MFSIRQPGRNRLDMTMSGRLNTGEMRSSPDELATRSMHIRDGQLLYEVVEFYLPTPAAIQLEFSRLPSMRGFLKKNSTGRPF